MWLAVAVAVVLPALLLGVSPAPQRAVGDTPGREEKSTVRSEGSTGAPTAAEDQSFVTAEAGEGDGETVARPSAEEGPPGAVPLVHPVDLAALREKLPDNLYWQLGAPTEDDAVLSLREEEERRMNELFGKVQSNTASEEEIHRHYERRREISEDYIEFASAVLEDHGAELPDSEKGLYALSVEMHRARLKALPRQIEDALARKKAHDRRRAERIER